MKVGIVIICYNIPSEVFLLQIAAIKKFCKDEFDILIIDNSTDAEKADHIRYHSENNKLSYTKTFAGGKGSSDSHSFASNFAFQKFKNHYEYMLYLDHDAIPIREFSVIDILKGGHVIAGIGQEKRKKYIWPGCLLLNLSAIDKELVDFSPSSEFNLDTGGNLYILIEKYGEEACIFFNEAYHQNPGFVSKEYGYYATINDEMFLHFINASGWNSTERQSERISSLVNVVKEKTGL